MNWNSISTEGGIDMVKVHTILTGRSVGLWRVIRRFCLMGLLITVLNVGRAFAQHVIS
jgi:hypothetical protein